MQEDNSQPEHKTIEDIELLVSIYAYQKELLACLKEGQGRLPDPKFRSEIATRRLAVEARRYFDKGVRFSDWPSSLQQWCIENYPRFVPKEYLGADNDGYPSNGGER